MTQKLRVPSVRDKENAMTWLENAKYELSRNEFYRVKQLCSQVIRALRRKDYEK